MRRNSPDISKGIFKTGVEVRSLPPQPRSAAFGPASLSMREMAANGELSGFGSCLRAPVWRFWAGKLSKVSGQTREYSCFKDTVAGDSVQSRLPPEGRQHVDGA